MMPKRLLKRSFRLEALWAGITGTRRLEAMPCSAGPLTAEMMREMLGHLPFSITTPPEKWEWMANYLNETLRDPSAVCPCCNTTRSGELMDHLPPPQRFSLPNVRPLAPADNQTPTPNGHS